MGPSKLIVLKAIQAATQSTHDFRVGAIVWRNKNDWALGHNRGNKTHPKSPHPFNSIHAEFNALTEMLYGTWPEDVSGYKMYVHRLLKDGSPGLAKPCKYCQVFLSWAGIKEVYYSTENCIEKL